MRFLKIFRFVCVLLTAMAAPMQVEASNFDVHQFQVVSREELIKAMSMQTGYNALATTNVARHDAGVLLQLADWARQKNPDGPPLFIDHTDWFFAFLQVQNVSAEEAPVFARLAYQYKQDQIVEYRMDRVIKEVDQLPAPRSALNVKNFWKAGAHAPQSYSFEDTLATPNLLATDHRIITYRLLDYGDEIVYDRIRGIYGRPLNGVLGFLFRLIGEGRVEYSKIMISKDGLQIVRARSVKGPLSVTATATIFPDGRAQKGIPANRPDLIKIEEQLQKPLRIKYRPFDL